MYLAYASPLDSTSVLNHYLKLPAAAVAETSSASVPVWPLRSDAIMFFIMAALICWEQSY